MAVIHVRPSTEGDLETLLDLFEAVAAEGRWIGSEAPIDRPARLTQWRDALTSESKASFVAEHEGELVGLVGAEQRVPGLVSLGMAVAGDHRGKGVGSALLKECIAWARSTGAHKLTLEVWPHNQAAIRLYEKFGFEVEGRLRKQYRRKSGELWDSVVMGLVLDPGED